MGDNYEYTDKDPYGEMGGGHNYQSNKEKTPKSQKSIKSIPNINEKPQYSKKADTDNVQDFEEPKKKDTEEHQFEDGGEEDKEEDGGQNGLEDVVDDDMEDEKKSVQGQNNETEHYEKSKDQAHDNEDQYLKKDGPEDEPQKGDLTKVHSGHDQNPEGNIGNPNDFDTIQFNTKDTEQDTLDPEKEFGFQKEQHNNEQHDGEHQKTDDSNNKILTVKTHADRVKEQNQKLRKELKMLAQLTDEAIMKEKKNKIQRKMGASESDKLKMKKQLLLEQLQKIESIKHEVQKMKRQLQVTYNVQKIKEQEDRLKVAQKLLDERLEEKNSLQKIKKEQNRALVFLEGEGQNEERLNNINAELREVKQDMRTENETYLENEAEMYKVHARYRDIDGKVNDLKNKIRKAKRDQEKYKAKRAALPPRKKVTKEEVEQMEEMVKEIRKKKEHAEKHAVHELKAIEHKKAELKKENQKLLQYLKEKEKEIRLNNLRLKEMRKLTRHNALQPLQLDKKESLSEIKKDTKQDSKISFDPQEKGELQLNF